MGNGLIKLYREKVQSSWKTAFLSTVIIGLITHMYKFTNALLNHDSLSNYYSSQNVVGSGRWFLSISCALSSYFNLHFVIGILSIFFIALTAVVISDIFKVKNSILLILIGGLLITFPSVAATFYYGYTADGYMLSMLFAALSVRLSTVGQKKVLPFVVSAVLICLTFGIYQAYVSFAMVLALLYFAYELLENKYGTKDYLIWIGKQLLVYAAATVAYYVIWKLCLYFQKQGVNDYYGINELGNFSMAELKGVIVTLIPREFIHFFFEKDSTVWNVFNALFAVSSVVILVVSVAKSKLYKKAVSSILFVLSLLLTIYASYIWMAVSPGVEYGTRMEAAMCLYFIFIAILFERWARAYLSTAAAVLMIAVICNNAITTNIFYFYLERCNIQSYSIATEMSTRMHLLDDGIVKKIAVVGAYEGLESNEMNGEKQRAQLQKFKFVSKSLLVTDHHIYLYLANEIDFTLSYYKINPEAEMPIVQKYYLDAMPENQYRFPAATDEETEIIKQTDEYKNMPCWPAADSIKVINETIVVKLSQETVTPQP